MEGKVLEWFKYYFFKHQQQVEIDLVLSDKQPLTRNLKG